MRFFAAIAMFAAAACGSDPSYDPAWTTPGSALACTQATTLPSPIGSWHATWACEGTNETEPCDPAINPLLGEDVVITAGAGADEFVVTIGSTVFQAARFGSSDIRAEEQTINGYVTGTDIGGCEELSNPIMLFSQWYPIGVENPPVTGWRATLK